MRSTKHVTREMLDNALPYQVAVTLSDGCGTEGTRYVACIARISMSVLATKLLSCTTLKSMFFALQTFVTLTGFAANSVANSL